MKSTITDETTPLLVAQAAEDPASSKPKPITPLPKLQLGQPIAYTQIFPYINEFLNGLHVTDDPRRIGFYSGLVMNDAQESTYAIFQLFSIYHFAKLSDRIGRRPIILCGVTGVALSTFLFGLSTSLPMMLVFRALAGLSSGNAAIMQSVVSEVTDASNFGRAAPLFGLSWPLGSILGPLLGGALSTPADKYAWLDFEFLRRYPYFLPGGVSSVVTLIAVITGYFFLRETLPSKVRAAKLKERAAKDRSGSVTPVDVAEVAYDAESDKPLGMRALLANPAMRALVTSNAGLSFLCTGYEVVFVLYAYTAVPLGGLGFPARQIGYALSVSGLVSVAGQLVLMPWLLRTFDAARMYNLCFWMFPFLFPLMSALNLIARAGYDEIGWWQASGTLSAPAVAGVWAGIVVMLLMSRFAVLAFALSMILIKQHCPSENSVGMAYGLASFAQCLARALSPTIMSSIYALAQEYNILHGLGWVPAMVLISLGGVLQSASVVRATR
ncbi:hypothetical protein HWV62_12847 [Athelia sp. TMB]|nr:hypothetical protein HWV62_12847 [Athelia sp. TMB]